MTSKNVFGASLSRRGFVKTGGSLLVGFSLLKADTPQKTIARPGNEINPALPNSWIEIHADNTILIRTGKSDFGQSTIFTAYRQIVAEELGVPFQAITKVISGDTDRTPDGGGTYGLLAEGMPNIRKAAAYVHQALLELASQQLGVPKDQLSVKDGIVVGGAGKSVSYGDLVKNQQLSLTIPVKGDLQTGDGLTVEGNPPLKPVSQYAVVGKSFSNPAVVPKVTAKETWVTDVRLPGMLHGRVVHPKTLGSKLISAGPLDKARFPNAQVIVKGNLVGVVAPTEWEAIQAAQHVGAGTKWSDWKGLPGSDRLYAFLKEDADWKSVPPAKSDKSKGNVAAALAGSPKKLTATYERPFLKHAPIGPTMATADVRPDGTVYVYSHTQYAQALRRDIAHMLGTPVDKVVVRTFAGAGHYGRSNGGNAGAEDEAVILSQAVGKPVRVQWMRPDDFQWSTQSSAALADVKIGLDAKGNLAAFEIDHYMPAMQDDRLVGAILAGLPTIPAPDQPDGKGVLSGIANDIEDPWIYDGTPTVLERAYGTFQIGQKSSPINVGLRDHSLRTPGQYQQNFPRELAITEAALLAGIDPIQFRIQHTHDQRAVGALESVRDSSGWRTGSMRLAADGDIARGQGVAIMLRAGTYWACVAQIAVNRKTGAIKVEKIIVSVDPGIVVNPLQLKRQIEGGSVMGVSMTLFEEVRFDQSGVVVNDWRSYPIATMADLPEIKVVLINRPEVGSYGQGSEAANSLAAPAIAGAFLHATGKAARRLPLKPDYVQSLLRA